MSWQQRESPVSWEGLGVSPSLTVAPCHSLALNTTDHGPSPHQGGLCGSHPAFNPPPALSPAVPAAGRGAAS